MEGVTADHSFADPDGTEYNEEEIRSVDSNPEVLDIFTHGQAFWMPGLNSFHNG